MVLTQHNINNVNDPVGRPVVHLDHVSARGLAGDGDEGSAGMLGHGDLLAGPGHHGVGAGVEGRGEDQPRGHVAQQRGLQQVRVREKLLANTRHDINLDIDIDGQTSIMTP